MSGLTPGDFLHEIEKLANVGQPPDAGRVAGLKRITLIGPIRQHRHQSTISKPRAQTKGKRRESWKSAVFRGGASSGNSCLLEARG
jgi:hypothetical protein